MLVDTLFKVKNSEFCLCQAFASYHESPHTRDSSSEEKMQQQRHDQRQVYKLEKVTSNIPLTTSKQGPFLVRPPVKIIPLTRLSFCTGIELTYVICHTANAKMTDNSMLCQVFMITQWSLDIFRLIRTQSSFKYTQQNINNCEIQGGKQERATTKAKISVKNELWVYLNRKSQLI